MIKTKLKFWRPALILLYLLFYILPGYVFFSVRGGLQILRGLDFSSANSLFFPLFGLYAFTLVSLQLIIGSNMRRLRPIFPKIMNFHRLQGLVALTFVLIHPLMVLAAFGVVAFINRSVVPSSVSIYILPAQLALVIIPVTVITAVAAWKFRRLTRVWRYLHYANYLAFALVWVHSWFVGSDIQSTPLKYVWLFYAAAALISVFLRLKRGFVAAKNPSNPS